MKLFIRAAIVVAIVLGAQSAAHATQNANEGVCQPQDQHVQGGEFASIEITAPDGQLISGYCVKAGSIQQGNGPEYVTLDTPGASVTIEHGSGKDISHYVVFYVEIPPPTTTTTVPEDTCEEDEPCWDCETMGNHECGPTPTTLPPTTDTTQPRVYECSDGNGNGYDLNDPTDGVCVDTPVPSDPQIGTPLIEVPTATTTLPMTGFGEVLVLAIVGLFLVLTGWAIQQHRKEYRKYGR